MFNLRIDFTPHETVALMELGGSMFGDWVRKDSDEWANTQTTTTDLNTEFMLLTGSSLS